MREFIWGMLTIACALAAVPRAHPARYFVFLLRLLAFILIIVGIVDKNRSARSA